MQTPRHTVERLESALAVARRMGYGIREEWLDGVETAGVTSGASAPEKLVARVCDWFRARGVEDITPYKLVEEDVEFRLPVELRRELALAEAQR